jgi:hypothetical protein
VARYFFHLAGCHDTIPDEEGVEVTDLEEACIEAVQTIKQLQRENPAEAAKWNGWRLDVADRFGTVAFSIRLDALE